MKVLITGATGFLGSHLAEKLIEHGHEVRALVRKTSRTEFLEELGVELCHASLESGEGLDAAVRGVDGVAHSAAIVKARDPEEFHRVNALGTKHLLDAVLEHTPKLQRFVYVSSMTAHGFGDGGKPRALDREPHPVTHYGRSKLAGEQFCLDVADTLPVTILRPPAIYGPRDTEMLAFFKIVQGRVVPFLGSPDNNLSLVYAPDCAEALLLTLTKDHPSGAVYYVEDGEVYTQRQVVAYIEDALGKRAFAKFPVPMAAVSVAAVGSELFGKISQKAVMLTRDKVNELREQQVCSASDAIRADLGWTPTVQFGEGARISVDWYRQNGLL
ncbi:MAG: NAD(P)-dependent oxidoreductase [Myxococcota bacterium]